MNIYLRNVIMFHNVLVISLDMNSHNKYTSDIKSLFILFFL